MPSQEDINQQLERLTTCRRTLAYSLKQQAEFGALHAPPGVMHEIWETRKNILSIKVTLRGWGVSFEDHPDDEEPVICNHCRATNRGNANLCQSCGSSLDLITR